MKLQTQRVAPRDGVTAAQQATHPANDPGKTPVKAPGQGGRPDRQAVPPEKGGQAKPGKAAPASR